MLILPDMVADTLVIGVDEVGRGPLAGPVVAGAVILGERAIVGLDDSKKLSRRRREALEGAIKEQAQWAIGVVTVEEIDRINILNATLRAMTLAVQNLLQRENALDRLGSKRVQVLIDGNITPHGRVAQWCWSARAIVGGDGSEPAISAASIIAKTYRDRLMQELALGHPFYGWERNAGYGTAEHLAALHRFGPTLHHRTSFAPVAQVLAQAVR